MPIIAARRLEQCPTTPAATARQRRCRSARLVRAAADRLSAAFGYASEPEPGGEGGGTIFAVIPGRHVAPDPKSRYKFGACFWIPGSLVLLAPRNDGESEASHAPACELCPARRDPGGAAAI